MKNETKNKKTNRKQKKETVQKTFLAIFPLALKIYGQSLFCAIYTQNTFKLVTVKSQKMLS